MIGVIRESDLGLKVAGYNAGEAISSHCRVLRPIDAPSGDFNKL